MYLYTYIYIHIYIFMKELDSVEGLPPAVGEGNICIYKYIFLHIYMYICYISSKDHDNRISSIR
jgi:hypothetical protein